MKEKHFPQPFSFSSESESQTSDMEGEAVNSENTLTDNENFSWGGGAVGGLTGAIVGAGVGFLAAAPPVRYSVVSAVPLSADSPAAWPLPREALL